MFEIETMEQQFDYSLVDNDTADFLRSCEYEINGIAEDARVKFGSVLIKAQDKLAKKGYGVFTEWIESGGISKDDAYYYINLNRTSRNLDERNKDNFLKAPKTVQKKVMRKNTPEEIKEGVYSGDIKTNKEFIEAERRAEQAQQRADEAERKAKEQAAQLEQAHRSHDILQSRLDEAENQEPEKIEVEKEIVPEDYEQTKQALEDFKSKFNRESQSAESLRKELQKYQEAFSDPRKAYDEKEEKRLARDSSINAYRLAISIQKFIEDNAVETYKISSVIKANEPAKERLEENIELLKDFIDNIESILRGRILTK